MDYEHEKRKAKEYPKIKANIISKLLFVYMLPLIKTGFFKKLEEKDLYELPPEFSAKKLGDELEEKWEKQIKSGKFSVIKLLWHAYGKFYFLLGFLQLFVSITATLIQPIAIAKFLAFFAADQTEMLKSEACGYALLVIGVKIIQSLFNTNYYLKLIEIGVKARTGICSLIYRKSLKLKSSDLDQISTGNIVTLITKDVLVFGTFVESANDIWIGIVRSTVAWYMLYTSIGVSSLVPVVVFLIIAPLQGYLGQYSAKLRVKVCRKTDERLQLTKEVLSAIKIVKMYTWEKVFVKQIDESRKQEMKLTFVQYIIRFLLLAIGMCSRVASFFAMILAYVWLGNIITVETLYFSMRCFQLLTHTISDLLPVGIAQCAELYAAIIRISFILNYKTISQKRDKQEVILPKIILKNVNIQNGDQVLISNINLSLNPGVIVVTGSVGSGKTTLLKTILGDYQPKFGSVQVRGRLSYASQIPWLFPSTVKQNIIFGQEFNRARYQKVLEICALKYDLENLQDGDETIIEDNGSNFSVGQQARINLARALYKDADIYLLDDCLAALDPRVADYLFKNAILRFLNGKLVVMISYNYSTQCNNVVEIVDNGIVTYENNFQNKKLECDKNNTVNTEEVIKVSSTRSEPLEKDSELVKLIDEAVPKNKLYYETQKEGQVDYAIYFKYIKFGGGIFALIGVFLAFVVAQGSETGLYRIVSDWVHIEQAYSNMTRNNATNTTRYEETKATRNFLFMVEGILLISTLTFILIRAVSLFAFTRKASICLHKKMASAVVHAKMEFFDTTFTGNILNRFSKDLLTIDETVPMAILHTVVASLMLIGIIFLIASVNLMFLIPTAIFFFSLGILRKIYLATGRSLKRLDASTRSPVIGYLNSTLEGLITIKAANIDDILIQEFDQHQDLYTSANYTLQASIKTFTLWLDSMCTFFITAIVARFLIFDKDTLASYVGLAVSQAFMMTEKLEFGIRQWAEVENQMTSVERGLQYTEAEQESKQGCVIDNWPESGDIIYEKVYLKYPHCAEPILKNINCHIKSGEKIGVVGRTGAGKSTLLSTLFRLYDVQGQIVIDGIDIKTVSLNYLRSKISIIPQNPILFSGTIRDNIDPEGKYTNEQVSEAITSAHLNSFITDLDHKIESGGIRMSAGQKQLICIARAIIRQNKIIVLDEATANLDPTTDDLIQKVLQVNFTSCTVMVIAHRLHTILNCDRVMVIDRGQIEEFDSPDNLKVIPNGIFRKMLEENDKLLLT